MTHVLENLEATILDLITAILSETDDHAALASSAACLAFAEVLSLASEAARLRSVAIAARLKGNIHRAWEQERNADTLIEEARKITRGEREPSNVWVARIALTLDADQWSWIEIFATSGTERVSVVPCFGDMTQEQARALVAYRAMSKISHD